YTIELARKKSRKRGLRIIFVRLRSKSYFLITLIVYTRPSRRVLTKYMPEVDEVMSITPSVTLPDLVRLKSPTLEPMVLNTLICSTGVVEFTWIRSTFLKGFS